MGTEINTGEFNAGAAPASFPSGSRSFARTGRVIVAHRDAQERKELRAALEFEGHRVVEVETEEQALQETSHPLRHDVLICSSEGIEAYELCRTIRQKSDLGIIVVAGDETQQDTQHDPQQRCIDALNAGADDHVSSPFVLRELLARVRAVLRRVTRPDERENRTILQDRVIDFKSHKIRGPGGRVSHLTPKEFLVLQCLVAHANTAFTHRRLSQTIWQRDGGGEVEYVRVVIGQLRRKLEPDPDNPRYILTERSVGYRFHIPPPAGQSATPELSSPLSLAG